MNNIYELLRVVNNIEGHFFNNIENDKNKRQPFTDTKCNICGYNSNLPFCHKSQNFNFLNCYLHYIREYLDNEYRIKWMTITLFPPSTDGSNINYNLADQKKSLDTFYNYFNQTNNYSASQSIFISRIEEIRKNFGETDIFEIHYDYSKKEITVRDALSFTGKTIQEQPSKVDFNNYTDIMKESSGSTDFNYLYFFIYESYSTLKEKEKNNKLFSGLYIPSDDKKEEKVLKEISIITKIFLTPIEKIRGLLLLRNEFENKIGYSMKAAIAAIMSRNGSHNIGSHVLSAVSSKINDLGDDKVLYNYIQERMDFIAQITTETPKWTFSTAFIQDLIRRFYMQRHLLNYISSSEGLSAYEYQNHVVKNEEIKDRLIVRIVNDKNEEIVGPEIDKDDISLKDFFLIAIPGGIVGQQAFFTILENIIRNTAKHNWANSTYKKDQKNLIITIKYFSDPTKDFVLFKIYDNVSDVFNGLDMIENNKDELAKTLLPHKVEDVSEEKPLNKKLPLHQEINTKLVVPFVNEDSGQLRNENWGLAEIKICSAFLNKKSVEDYGLLKENILYGLNGGSNNGFLSAIGEKDDNNYRLCYQITIPKPKEVLIIGDCESLTDNEKLEANKDGIYFSPQPPEEVDYDIVVFTQNNLFTEKDILTLEKYPFRLILLNESLEIGSSLKNRIHIIKKSFKDVLNDLDKEDKKLSSWDILKLYLYKEWLSFQMHKRNIRGPIPIYIRRRENSIVPSEKNNDEIENYLREHKIVADCKEVIKKILIKYEEDIETLPMIFRAKYDSDPNNRKYEFELNLQIKDIIKFSSELKCKIQLKRHFKSTDMLNNNDNYLYQESLSGSQIYFNLFETNLSDYQQNKFLLQLLENALLRVLIIDERYLAHFDNPNDKYRKKIISNANISTYRRLIFSNNSKEIKIQSENDNFDFIDFDELEENKYDALVIHQTILDEFFNNDIDRIEKFCEQIKNKIPLVVITSGRGKPDKLVDNAKFLPFSNLDSYLIKEYHEKFLFTQIILKLTRGFEK